MGWIYEIALPVLSKYHKFFYSNLAILYQIFLSDLVEIFNFKTTSKCIGNAMHRWSLYRAF